MNSVDPRIGDQQQDYLISYADLVQWSGYAHVLAEYQVAALLCTAAQQAMLTPLVRAPFSSLLAGFAQRQLLENSSVGE